MGLFTEMKALKAMRVHGKGDIERAKELYQQALDKGCMSARPMLSYALLMLREGKYQPCMDLLVRLQKAPDLTPERKSQLFIYYAACCAKTGDLEKGVSLLERQHNRAPTGLTYQTMGYLYTELYDQDRKPVADENTVIRQHMENLEPGDEAPIVEGLSVEEKQARLDADWAEGKEKAMKLLEESIDYDDEDAVCMDNMAQFYYRVLGDKATAKTWFDKAHEEKPGQIDSLWFLSRYDLEAGDTAAAIEKLETAMRGNFSPLNFADRAMVEAELKRLKGN